MRLLLASGGFRTEERVAFLGAQMRAFFGSAKRLLFIPYALHDHDRYQRMLVEKKLDAGYVVDGIHESAKPRAAVEKAEAIYVGGGNTFRLLSELYRHDLLDVIRRRVGGGVPYLGISAGANVACPTVKTTNDMPIIQPPSLDALGLVPFQINPHYFAGQTHVKVADAYHEHFGETRDDRIREFHEMNDLPVIGLWEGGLLHVDNNHITLHGSAARVFRKGRDPVDVQSGARLDDLMNVPNPSGGR
jgi:dipeptidase E